MNEYRCGTCGWGAVARSIEGIISASADHEKAGCGLSAEQEEKND